MKITKVCYGKTYPLGNYSSERIDLECSVEDGEDISLAMDALKRMCDIQHKENNPHLYQEQDTKYQHPISEINNYNTIDRTELRPKETSQTIDNKPKKLSQKELIQSEISKATTPKQLTEWKLLSDNYPELKEIYQKKYEQLTNK